MVRTLVQRSPDCPIVAGSCEFSIDDQQHRVRKRLDLFKDVRRDQDCAARVGLSPQQMLEMNPLPRVGAVQRLVEY